VLAAGADWVHFDVMDNHYVPNLTIGPLVCEALRKHGVTAPIDVHLMVEPVDRIVPDFAKAGASDHQLPSRSQPTRAPHHPADQVARLPGRAGAEPGHAGRSAGLGAGRLDLVLLMSVNPGFGGQAFIPSTLDKLRAVRAMIDATGKPIRLEVDGGVKADNIGEIAAAGADAFVAGSAIFSSASHVTPV
jgi:ribulose-phosphate 3-epimerase